jgi:hypothetical protein
MGEGKVHGMVGIWWEFGGNDSQSRSNLGGLSLT